MIPAVPKDTVVVVEVEVERLVLEMKGHGLILERQMVQVVVAFLLAFTVQQQQQSINAEQEKGSEERCTRNARATKHSYLGVLWFKLFT